MLGQSGTECCHRLRARSGDVCARTAAGAVKAQLADYRPRLQRALVPARSESLALLLTTVLLTPCQVPSLFLPYVTPRAAVGYSVGSLVMGHLVHIYKPFKLMAVGLAIWVFAVAIW